MKFAAPSRIRTVLAVSLSLALAVLGSLVIVRYRHDHRDEFRHSAYPWRQFETSGDGRTLRFSGAYGSSSCGQPDRVEIESGDPVVATVYYKAQSVRDGHAMFCTADLAGLPPVSITLAEPLPDGTLVVDGYEASATNSYPLPCPRTEQRVGEPPPSIPDSPFSC
jgi:hypothetical protein